MDKERRVPDEMIGDIIKVFLLGIRDSKPKPIIYNAYSNLWCPWRGVLKHRSIIIEQLNTSNDKEINELSKSLAKIFKLIKEKERKLR